MYGQNKVFKQDLSSPDILEVHEIFPTLQGEGPFAGHAALFVRLSNCTLRCWWCFGWRKGCGRQPYVTLSHGNKKKLGDVRVGDVILTMDDNLDIVETTVTAKLKRKVDEWLRITISGRTYWVTPEHPFFTKRGMIKADELKLGDVILEVKSNDLIAFKKLGDRNPIHQPGVREKINHNYDRVAAGRKLSKTIASKKASGVYRSTWDGMTEETKAATRAKIAESKRGSRNPMWRDDLPIRNFEELKKEVRKGLHACERCSSRHDLHVHHKDGNHRHDRRSNFEVLCRSCHSIEHRNGYNFWINGNRSDGKVLQAEPKLWTPPRPRLIVEKARNGKVVQKIVRVNRWDEKFYDSTRPKILTVHNITCEPYTTFLADNMWVHNCDTAFDQVNKVNVEDIVKQAVTWRASRPHANLVVITGGEPFRQNLQLLLKLLAAQRFHVQIETAGTHWFTENDRMEIFCPYFATERDGDVPGAVTIICSPKTPLINADIAETAACFKYIVAVGDSSPDDGLPIMSTQLKGKRNRLYRPQRTLTPDWTARFDKPIYVQPRDDGDDVASTAANVQHATALALTYGYRLSIQTHKLLNLP